MKQLIFFVIGILLIYSKSAQAEDTLKLTNAVFQEITIKGEDGKVEHKTVPATQVVPGTEVFYVITYENIGKKPAENVVISNPIPKDLEYLSASIAESVAALEVSVDGGKTYDELSRLTVTGSDGKPSPARASDVTDVRWSLGSIVKPGEKGDVSFRAKLK